MPLGNPGIVELVDEEVEETMASLTKEWRKQTMANSTKKCLWIIISVFMMLCSCDRPGEIGIRQQAIDTHRRFDAARDPCARPGNYLCVCNGLSDDNLTDDPINNMNNLKSFYFICENVTTQVYYLDANGTVSSCGCDVDVLDNKEFRMSFLCKELLGWTCDCSKANAAKQ